MRKVCIQSPLRFYEWSRTIPQRLINTERFKFFFLLTEIQVISINKLYELSDDAKRKEWLDDWLSFMHRIGKPVTRIPIMAKQVLDLYELYRLVVQHGGLVEIINKKLWREITKGLNLPSSITSAAFTLRTQYQKYLYDYECEKEALSNPSDLQAAIDGNRREGRRNASAPNFGPLGYPLPHASTAANLLTKPFNGLGVRTGNYGVIRSC
ncbi:unnamed protein product [Angiostrongylus costaricensis]|uniref:ARID domain-containing protein n=1 Tax=Angiostrongylus costaricensis TaxID=334426 RepID=A0A3P7JM48_ANGCS|nr:unnamed protein product [Angiostrongylus costaricensis]